MSKRSRTSKTSEPKPKTLHFNLTPQGYLIKSSGQPRDIEFFDRKFVDYGRQMQSMDSDYAYATAISKIRVVVDEIALNRRRPISCQAGCAACCHTKVDIVPWEAAAIEKHLEEHSLPLDKERLVRQSQALESNTFEQLPFAERRCVFLNEEQKCSIYELRPLMCRRHFVQSDPAHCRSEDYARIETDVNTDVDAYLSAYVTRNPTTALPKFLHQLLSQQASGKGQAGATNFP